MSQEAIAEPAAPVAESAAPVADASVEFADLSFFDAIDAALNPQPEPEPTTPEPATPEPEPESSTSDRPPSVDDVEDQSEDPDVALPIDDVGGDNDDGDIDFKAEKSFARIKSRLKDTRNELASERAAREQLEARLAELEAADSSVEELRQRVTEYEEQLSIVKLESTAAYKDQVQEPLNFIVDSLSDIATRNEIDSDALIDAVALSDQAAQDAAFEDLLAGMSERDKLKVYALAEEIEPIMQRRQKLFDNVDAALSELEEQQRIAEENAAVERMQKRKGTVELVGRKLADKVPFLNDDEYGLSETVKRATETDFASLDPANQSYSYISGLLVPKMAKQIAALQSQLEEAFDELNGYKKSAPSAGGGSGQRPAGPPAQSAAGSFLDAINSALG